MLTFLSWESVPSVKVVMSSDNQSQSAHLQARQGGSACCLAGLCPQHSRAPVRGTAGSVRTSGYIMVLFSQNVKAEDTRRNKVVYPLLDLGVSAKDCLHIVVLNFQKVLLFSTALTFI